jgi:hypothetical protein
VSVIGALLAFDSGSDIHFLVSIDGQDPEQITVANGKRPTDLFNVTFYSSPFLTDGIHFLDLTIEAWFWQFDFQGLRVEGAATAPPVQAYPFNATTTSTTTTTTTSTQTEKVYATNYKAKTYVSYLMRCISLSSFYLASVKVKRVVLQRAWPFLRYYWPYRLRLH